MTKPTEILKAALELREKDDALSDHLETIAVLKAKRLSWREIAQFLNEHGIQVDHTRVFRFAKANEEELQRIAGRRLSMAKSNELEIPEAAQYANALQAISLSEKQKKMLEEHYRARNRTITFTELAESAGSSGHRTANMLYGKLGRKLGESIGFHFAQAESGEPFYSSSIGLGSSGAIRGEEFRLVMHHELAKAIEYLGWFK